MSTSDPKHGEVYVHKTTGRVAKVHAVYREKQRSCVQLLGIGPGRYGSNIDLATFKKVYKPKE